MDSHLLCNKTSGYAILHLNQGRSQGGHAGGNCPPSPPKNYPQFLQLILNKNPCLLFCWGGGGGGQLQKQEFIIHQLGLSSLTQEEFYLTKSSTHSHLHSVRFDGKLCVKIVFCIFQYLVTSEKMSQRKTIFS